MLFSSLYDLFSAASIAFVALLRPTNGHSTQSVLTGTSFGVLGINQTFDYVIIGGGTAGLTLATRLAEDPLVSIAVIEAGGFYEQDNGNLSQIPGFVAEYTGPILENGGIAQPQPLIDWGFIVQPQAALANLRSFYAQGKTLGGGSARNYVAYQRPTRGSLDLWASTVGDESYKFESVLPLYEKSVEFTPPNSGKIGPGAELIKYTDAPRGGPLQVSFPNYLYPISKPFYDAFKALGLAAIPGFNNGSLIGTACFTCTIDPAQEIRSSSESSFLQSALRSPNLKIYHNTVANKILLENRAAYAVNVTTAGISYVLSADKEVILSAGAFKSPQLLMLSGIGPKEMLSSFDIPLVADLAGVGQNLEDQPFFSITNELNIMTASALNDPQVLNSATEQFLANKTGPLTSPGFSFAAWEKLPTHLRNTTLKPSDDAMLAEYPSDWPELELLPIAAPFAPVPDNAMYASLTVALLTFTSRGNVTISSTNIDDLPLINPNWLATGLDQRLAIAGIRRAREVVAAANGIAVSELAPGANITSDADIFAYLQKTTATIHHASCTCKMGMANDTMAVVDSKGKVFGVKGLRVVDASAFPFTPPEHTQSTVYMLAEKIAEDIKNERLGCN